MVSPYESELSIEIGAGMPFIKMFDNTFDTLRNAKLTGKQWKILLTLLNNFQDGSGLVCFDNENPIGANDIAELAGVSMKTVFSALNKFVSKKILKKSKLGNDIRYYVNPLVFCKG